MIAGQWMGYSIGRAVLTEDIRHFQAGRGSHSWEGLRNLLVGFIEGTCDLGQVQTTDMEIDGGRCRGSVTKEQLDMVETRSGLNQMGGKAVPQGMHAGRFGNAGTLLRLLKDLLDRAYGDVIVLFHPIKQPLVGMILSPIFSQMFKSSRGQNGIAVLASLALCYPDHHPLAVNIGDLQAGGFTGPQSRGIGDHQNRLVFEVRRDRKKGFHLREIQNDREFPPGSGRPDLLHQPFPFQRRSVEKFESGHIKTERPFG